jgi:DNA polymerase III sliding clamp (beta) subunit (PCNA family)
MSDIPSYCRMRFRTTAGHQIILDDTNERIYVSTAKGKSWIELDENGTINVYSDSKLNITGNNDVNIHSNENLNLSAAKRVNIVSEQGSIQLSAKTQIKCVSTHGNINLLASRDLSFKTTNGPRAEATPEVSKADDAKVVEVYSSDSTIGENTYKISVKTKPLPFSVVLNWKYLLDGLKIFKGEEIEFRITERPIIIRSASDGGMVYVVMPIGKS